MVKSLNQILVVDADAKVLSAFERVFAEQYRVVTFDAPEAALAWLKENPGVAVVVSAINLPGMGGISFLCSCEMMAPLAARILLTAEKSLDVVKQAVNSGHVFMMLTKPCSQAELTAAVQSGMAQHRRSLLERSVLERTLSGSVKLLIEMLSLFHSEAFRRTAVMRPQAMRIAQRMGLKKTWELDMAVMFSPLGEALLPKEILARYRSAKPLTDQQREILARAPAQTRDLLKNIPQLDRVAECLYLSNRGFDGSGFPVDGPVGTDIPVTSRILKVLTDLWFASPETGVDAAAFEALAINRRQYDPEILKIAREELLDQSGETRDRAITLCYIRALRPGDVLVDDVLSEGSHELVLSRGHQLTGTTIRRLDHYNHVSGIRQPIRVHREEVPPASLDDQFAMIGA
ncbi:HD domain-containing phosphohydrolase [Roseibium litorale]|uniref:Response regulator n=1 Tax=Roseibium litorale TaxID=2803841 RepID=A0ABR9CNG0_9HYPH|nr:HD domain-containing phosphohydrolase [Roseibium litorale]MBD8892228.1 response regulator [Roseibium litorale]